MKKFITLLFIAACFYACNEVRKEPSAQPHIYNVFCNLPSSANSLCSHIPFDVNEVLGVGYDSFLDSLHQIPFDVFSWQTFVALNWPANASGKPIGKSMTDSPTAPRVWEYYTDPAAVFGHPSATLMLRLGSAKQSGQKFFYMDAKSPHPLVSGKMVDMNKFKEADGHPLIDRNLNFALYEIRMNPVETNFIIDSNLTTVQGIYAHGIRHHNTIQLPVSDSASNNLGSMEVKAAWRILVPALGDDTSRYYCRTATVFIDAAHTRNHKELTLTNVKVGLVGMHIIHKTARVANKEIWSTFEHIDNTPDNLDEAQMNNRQWSFYKPQCLNCPINTPPDTLTGDHGQYIWDTSMPYARRYAVKAPGQQLADSFGAQAVRVYPIYRYTQMVNRLWREKLRGTVWGNYRLIGTQWQQAEVNPQPLAPNNLGNTTLETYVQSTASCISCHSFATVPYKADTIATGLSFIFPVYARDTTVPPKKL